MSVLIGQNSRSIPQPGRWAPPFGAALRDVTIGAGGWSAVLDVPRDEPYFFDHPLDHMPGMALISGLLGLVRASATDLESAGRLTFHLNLPAFCDLDVPVRLESPDGVAVRARQYGRVCSEGTVEFVPGARRNASTPVDPRFAEPAPQRPVHRARSVNVMVSDVVVTGDVHTSAVRRPAPRHILATPRGTALPAEVLIDAARQYGTMLTHVALGVPADSQLVLLGMRAQLPTGVRDTVYLRWHATPPPRGRSTIDIDIAVGAPDAETSGRVSFDYFCAAPAIYKRLRERARAA
jgi:hypothetical protein